MYPIGSFGKKADAFISKDIYLDYKKRFSFPKKGDILISAAGTIGRTVVYNGEDAYYQDSNIIWIDNDNSKITNQFLYYILQIVKYNTEGGTIQRLYNKILKSTKFYAPSLKEQFKLSCFLQLIDLRIQTQNKIIEDYKLLKKGMVQKLFKQEIRFKDEKGYPYPKWKKRKLVEILNYEQPTKYLVSDTEYYDNYQIPVLTAGKTFLLGYTNERDGIFENKLPTIIFDDFTTAFKYVDFPFKAKSSAMKMLTPKDKGVNLKFVFEAMKTIKFPLAEHKRYWISEYQHEKIPSPSEEEQQKIASNLSAIDKKIELETNLLEILNKQKRYFLQNLFI